jgi:hypothetical protein
LAKNSDHLAGGFETDDTGGVLSGLLAEEDELDRRMLWRIGSWGVGAIGAVILAVMANQTSLGLKRDQMAAADLTRHAQNFQLAAKESQNEARRLASAVETLNGDRDRLYARVTSLEQGLDSVTGAIARQGSHGSQGSIVTAPPPAPATPAATAAPAPAVAPVASIQPTLSAPDKPAAAETNPVNKSSLARDAAKTDVAKPETAKTETGKPESAKTEIAKTEIAKTESARPESAKSEIAKSETAKSDIGKSDTIKSEGGRADTAKSDAAKSDAAKTDIAKADSAKTESQKADPSKTAPATPATPLVASKSIMAPPDPAAAKLIEPNKPVSAVTASPIPEVVASAPATDEEADEAISQKVAIQRTEFGIDLGTANSVGGLRALWRGLLKSKSNAPLTALRPIIVIKERNNGLGMQLRLVAGPLNDAGAAARICAVLTENKRSCETTIFDGQRLTMNSEDPPPVAAGPAQRRRGIALRTVAEEPPKKPETSAVSTISSMFGRKGQ